MKLYKYIVILSFIAGFINLKAQELNTLYFMDRVPEFIQLNPAFQPKCNVFVGFPGISGLRANFGNSSLSLNDVLYKHPSSGKLITYLHPDADSSNFYNALKDQNDLFINFRYDPLIFGFRTGSWYFSFSISAIMDERISFAKDFVYVLSEQQLDINADYNFNTFGINSLNYGEVALGVSKVVNEEFTFGVRGKLLSGFANISTDNKTFSITNTADPDTFPITRLRSDVDINVYMPFAEIPESDSFKFDNISNKKNFSFKPFENLGFATDFGVVYTGIERLKLSASVVDFGLISWSSNTYTLNMKANYTYNGTNIDVLGDSIDMTSGLSDSLENAYSLSSKKASYTTWLPLKLYIGAEYAPVKFFSLGIMSRTEIYKGQLSEQIMLSSNIRPFKMTMLSATYSIFDNGFSNFGLGMTFRIFPGLQYYFIYDHIPFKFGASYIPYKLKNFNFRFGFNFVFGCSGDAAKLKDKPSIFE